MVETIRKTRVKAPALTLDERETLISFDETPEDAAIFTYNLAWQKHLETRLGLKPVMDNGYGGKTYRIPKKRIPMPRVPKKLSAQQREKITMRLTEARHQKSLGLL